MMETIKQVAKETAKAETFAGTYYVATPEGTVTDSFGFANRAERIPNQTNTRYGIASGTKLLTAIAVCQLVDSGKLSLHAKLADCLEIDFLAIDPEITVHQLLTHTSGIADYFDEEVMDDYEELWQQTPVYQMRKGKDFLPLFQQQEMKEKPGTTFRYNNSGYIVLGLVVEQASGLPFSDYVEKAIFQKAGMPRSGFFEMDALPEGAALGYIDEENGQWRTNVFSVPTKGGADGGAYVTAPEMARLWQELGAGKLMSKEMVASLLAPHVQVEDDLFYGYGGYMKGKAGRVYKHIFMGYDPGVNFRMACYPETGHVLVVCSNNSDGAFTLQAAIETALFT
ncbi:serine hydrolase domain-containing protein [Shouchella clausii]|uniref:serine hydrolase domain-containing protein n=1 Tax=Shouchella clausii TaxID=79880 RepID=UPI000B99F87D|nr:serine hydrolase [Shouchella clausii]AST96507.1 penicillin-binding protein [Shouchella clausii]MCR1289520.1 beta-lactamase family protein [Shouchella clausii]MCY1103983.1 serine hydrolase [Shouchella clausii]MEB5474284.1 serine hydrolase [Shouchella clausii]WQG94277.1 serine hydrolase [Shouchella clausii]